MGNAGKVWEMLIVECFPDGVLRVKQGTSAAKAVLLNADFRRHKCLLHPVVNDVVSEEQRSLAAHCRHKLRASVFRYKTSDLEPVSPLRGSL